MNKCFYFLSFVLLLTSCSLFTEDKKDNQSVKDSIVETCDIEVPFIEGVWKGFVPYADSDENGATFHEFYVVIKNDFHCDLLGLREDLKNVVYSYKNNLLYIQDYVFSYEDGKLYLLNEEGKHFDMDNCYILELTPTEKCKK